MLQATSLIGTVHLSNDDFRRTLTILADGGEWQPAALLSERRFAELAGVPSTALRISQRNARPLPGRPDTPTGGADVFFKDDDIYYILNLRKEMSRVAYDPYGAFNPRSRVPEEDGILLGMVTASTPGMDQRFEGFVDAIEKAVLGTMDGRRARHVKFEWHSADVAGKINLQHLIEQLGSDGSQLRFVQPELNESLVSASHLLADKAVRQQLRELSEAVFARTVDILSRRGRKEEEVRANLERLKGAGLVTAEYLLQCKGSSGPLTRLASPEELENPAIANLRCGGCRRQFSDELLSEGFTVSDLGRTLTKGSHWMTLLVTAQLLELGVPVDSILWNLEESGEEVDILMDFQGQLWIMELKDREFGPGDAHPFNYRRVRYRARKSIIVTTEKVSSDAKRVFGELTRANGGANKPLMIEGLHEFKQRLSTAFEAESYGDARNKLRFPGVMAGYDLVQILQTRHSSSSDQTVPSSDLDVG